jgi:hypothetical protein
MFGAPAKAAVTCSSRNLYDSSHDPARVSVYRTSNYERNHSEKDHGRTNAVPAITGSEVIPRVNPKLFRERKELGIRNRSAALCHNNGYLSLANLRRRRCAERISPAHAELRPRETALPKQWLGFGVLIRTGVSDPGYNHFFPTRKSRPRH